VSLIDAPPPGRLAAFRGPGLSARVARGTLITLCGFSAQNALRLASNLVLTRLLFPEAFGLMALVGVVLTGVAMFSDLGIRGAVVSDPRGSEPAFLSTAFTLQILRGVFLGAAVFLAAAPVAAFYAAPDLEPLLRLAALAPVLQGLNSVGLMTANREIATGRLSALSLGAQVFGTAVSVALAAWLGTPAALVWGLLAGGACLAIASHLVLPGPGLRLTLERDALLRMTRFGRYIFLSTIAGFFVAQGDKLILGRFVALDTLAIYTIGFTLASMPVLLGQALNERIFFPLYARTPPRESTANKAHIDRVRRRVTAGLLLLLGGLAGLGDPLVGLLYDTRYADAGPMMTLITLALMPGVIIASYDRLPVSAGHTGRFAALVVARGAVHVACLVVGTAAFGLTGAILAPVAALCLTYPVLLAAIRPYGGWDALHDAGFLALAVALATALAWLRWPVLAPLVAPLVAP